MRTSRFTERQVVAALRQVENGTAVGEICGKLGISEQTFLYTRLRNEPTMTRNASEI